MNAISEGLRRIRHTIPKQVLESIFITEEFRTVEAGILANVIADRVIPDVGLHGYNVSNIPINQAKLVYQSPTKYVVEFSSRILDGKTIIGAYGLYNEGLTQAAILDGSATHKATFINTAPPVMNTHTKVIGKNTVEILIGQELPINIYNSGAYYLRVDLLDTGDLNTKTPRSLKLISKLIALATKAYIYNNALIPSQLSASLGGSDSSPIQDRIAEYADAEEEYTLLLEENIGVISLYEDGHTHESLVQMQTVGMILPGTTH